MNNLYKMSILWSAWTPQIATRIMRDVLAMQRLARTHRATLVIAADEPLHPKLASIGVTATLNFAGPEVTRVYVDQGTHIPDDVANRIPECSSVEVVSLGNGEPYAPGITVEEDPYAGIQFYKTWRRIPETMPLHQKAPPANGEPMISPFL